MSLISQETADKIYRAIQDIRDELPGIEAVAAVAAPAILPEIKAGTTVLRGLFEIVSVLLNHDAAARAVETLKDAQTDALAELNEQINDDGRP